MGTRGEFVAVKKGRRRIVLDGALQRRGCTLLIQVGCTLRYSSR